MAKSALARRAFRPRDALTGSSTRRLTPVKGRELEPIFDRTELPPGPVLHVGEKGSWVYNAHPTDSFVLDRKIGKKETGEKELHAVTVKPGEWHSAPYGSQFHWDEGIHSVEPRLTPGVYKYDATSQRLLREKPPGTVSTPPSGFTPTPPKAGDVQRSSHQLVELDGIPRLWVHHDAHGNVSGRHVKLYVDTGKLLLRRVGESEVMYSSPEPGSRRGGIGKPMTESEVELQHGSGFSVGPNAFRVIHTGSSFNIEVVSGPAKGQVISSSSFHRDGLTIGRGKANQVVLSSEPRATFGNLPGGPVGSIKSISRSTAPPASSRTSPDTPQRLSPLPSAETVQPPMPLPLPTVEGPKRIARPSHAPEAFTPTLIAPEPPSFETVKPPASAPSATSVEPPAVALETFDTNAPAVALETLDTNAHAVIDLQRDGVASLTPQQVVYVRSPSGKMVAKRTIPVQLRNGSEFKIGHSHFKVISAGRGLLKLSGVSGPVKGREFTLEGGKVTIGFKEGNTLMLRELAGTPGKAWQNLTSKPASGVKSGSVSLLPPPRVVGGGLQQEVQTLVDDLRSGKTTVKPPMLLVLKKGHLLPPGNVFEHAGNADIAPLHAVVDVSKKGARIFDNNANAGVYVRSPRDADFKRVPSGSSANLSPGHYVRIGRNIFLVQSTGKRTGALEFRGISGPAKDREFKAGLGQVRIGSDPSNNWVLSTPGQKQATARVLVTQPPETPPRAVGTSTVALPPGEFDDSRSFRSTRITMAPVQEPELGLTERHFAQAKDLRLLLRNHMVLYDLVRRAVQEGKIKPRQLKVANQAVRKAGQKLNREAQRELVISALRAVIQGNPAAALRHITSTLSPSRWAKFRAALKRS